MYEEPAEISGEKKESPKRPERVVLIASDIDLFKLVYEYRMLTREHLGTLTGRPLKRLHRRILQLAHAGYLETKKQSQQPHIYALGREGKQVLVEQGVAGPELLEKRSRIQELKPLGIKHELMLVDLHTTLALASRSHSLQLVLWREGRSVHDDEFKFRPDAFFTLEDSRRPAPANLAHCFLEADRASENHAQFRGKLLMYWDYFTQKRHVHKFGIQFFRVLTVTSTDARAKNLAVTARSFLPNDARRYFFFTSLKNFSLDNPAPIFEAVHFSPRDVEQRYPLVPAPKPAT
jgi:hypothetical protein